MKLHSIQPDRPPLENRSLGAATLVEVMFASAILVIVVGALLSAQMIGFQLNQLVSSKAGASDSSRRALNQLPMDIRSAKNWVIGNWGGGTNFTSIANGAATQGTALQLYFTTNNSTPYIFYYFDLSGSNSSNGKLLRTVSTNWNPVVIASNLINSLYFTAESYSGTVATNALGGVSSKNVIHTTLQFCQFIYPLTQVGSNYLYDSYQINFRATPHLPE